jgi:RNA polymerase sigma factor (sigma-70 family)
MAWYHALAGEWRRGRALRRAIARLPEQQRQIFLLTGRDGMPYREVAERLGISVETVETDLARALHSLVRAIEPTEPADSVGDR